METPSMLQTILAGIAVLAVVVAAIRYNIYSIKEWWRLRPGRHEHEGCYGRGDTCNIKFVTGGRG